MSQDAFSTDVQLEYNVYAAPFIPSRLRQINQQPGVVVDSPLRHFIDYPRYISSFAGLSYLPDRPYVQPQQWFAQAGSIQGPSANRYLDYFAAIWRTEIEAIERENGRFSLYKVLSHRVLSAEGQQLLSISIPGLREDSPLIELGDTLELRQVLLDKFTDMMQPPSNSSRPVQYGWTGIIYNGVVYGIHRAEELVYIRIQGLEDLWAQATHSQVFVNVVFPLKKRTIHACRDALMYTDHMLKPVVQEELQLLDGSFGSDLGGASPASPLRVNQNGGRNLPDQRPNGSPNDWIRRMLFPIDSDARLQKKLRTVPQRALFDPQVNYEQAQAVDSVCTGDYGTLPYLISGPPGTGKTKTLVEIAMQLLNSQIVNHILICAPSEAAADTLAIRLKTYLNVTQLLRLNGPWRADNEVPGELMPYCYIENDMFHIPPFKKLMAFNAVVTSCRDAAILADARLSNVDLWTIEKNMLSALHPEDPEPQPTLHWGALLLDEAAQATEPDALPAISVVCPPTEYSRSLPQPRLVMAGDENQLGPRTASRDPLFSTSLFARLFDRSFYKDHPLSRSKVKPSVGPPVLKKSMLPIWFPPFTNLIRNYRSHPAILSVPSLLFYHDTLLPEALVQSTPLQNCSVWCGRKWPVLFVPHSGLDEIERDGGGWYNILEASLACSFVETLITEGGAAQADICIMSPFAAQVKRLRSLIRSSKYGNGSGYWGVNIGPLEAFQGLEKRIVIICTTRTRRRFLEEDEKRGLGIVRQPRKMNVALTRAKEALIVVGDPDVLVEDEHWKEWLSFCWRNGLVWESERTWPSKGETFHEGKIGVLEKALLVKEDKKEHGNGRIKTLGASTAELQYGIDGDYEAWLEVLREAIEDQENDNEAKQIENESEYIE